MRMNDNPQLFHDNNKMTRRNAMLYLEEFSHRFTWKQKGSKIIDVGSGDGSVTNILRTYLPENYEILIGADIGDNMVKFANDHYGNEKTKFIKLDLEDKLPDDLRERFDHVFSFYLFHWIEKQEEAFTNIYNLMTKDGECFMTFVAYTHAYTIFIALSKTEKWGQYLKDVNHMVSPYYNIQDPDRQVMAILKKIGFKNITIRCKQTVRVYHGSKELKDMTAGVNPFKFPEEYMYEEFIDDYVEMAREMKLYDEKDNTFKFIYNVIVVYCTK